MPSTQPTLPASHLASHPALASPAPQGKASGVGGWLLLLCVMLVLVCPVIVAWVVSVSYTNLDDSLLASAWAHGAVVVALWLGLLSAALGVHGGLALWARRPGAVATARRALLWGLALELAAAALQVLAQTSAVQPGPVLNAWLMRLLPDLLFFTLCLGYLNKSTRVARTYPASPEQA